MATFNTAAITPPSAIAQADIAVIWQPENETVPFISFTNIVATIFGVQPRSQYVDGYVDGELYGFSSKIEEPMEPIQLGETDDDKKTIGFRIYDAYGFPASGNAGEGAVCSPAIGEIQTNRDLAGYVNAGGTFTHIADGDYRYTFSNAEVAGSEGNIWLRVKVPNFRTRTLRVPIRNLASQATAIRDAVLNAVRSGFVGTGTIGEGISIAASLLQGNFLMDTVTNGANGQTAARIRCFHSGAAAGAATSGGSGQGEFATFLITTTYSGPNKIVTHRVVQQ
jgi:hypothetical protein